MSKIEIGKSISVKLHNGTVAEGKVVRIGLETPNMWCMVEVALPDGKPAFFAAREHTVDPDAKRTSFLHAVG